MKQARNPQSATHNFIKNSISFFKKNLRPLLFLFLTWGIYFLIFWPKMLYINPAGDLVAGWRNIWADWAMHLTQANSFYHQGIIPVMQNHPVYSGVSLTYPFATNLISALIMKMGFNMIWAFVIPSIFFSWLLLLGLYFFGKTITKSGKQIIIAITIFLTSGGLGFIHFFADFKASPTLATFLHPPHEYTHMKDLGYYWTNTLLAHLVPQRAFLMGMSLGIFILAWLFWQFKNNFSKTKPWHMFGLGLITGLLAYIHNHTLIFMFLISAWLFIFSWKKYQYWLIFALGTTLTTLPFFILFPGPNFKDYLWFLPGWLANAQELNMNPAWFWLKNWGLFIPLAVAGFIVTVKDKYVRILLAGFGLIFLLGNIWVFQPSSWDNAKLFLWVYLAFSFPVAGLLLFIWQKHIIGKFIALFLFLILITSGSLDLIRVLKTSQESFVMVPAIEIELAQRFQKYSQPQDLVLTSDNHLHWAPVISGHSVVMGYRGWLWSHGYNYGQKESDIRKIYQGHFEAKKLIENYGIDFIVTDEKTKQDFGSNDVWLTQNFTLILGTKRFKVYRI